MEMTALDNGCVKLVNLLQNGFANCLLVGEVNLRQLRVRDTDCGVTSDLHPDMRCLPFYDDAVASNYTSGGGEWCDTRYENASETGSSSYHGSFATYDSDGYVQAFEASMSR
jgi:hypothetical protein